MNVTVNGEQTELSGAITVSELLTDQDVKMPDMVSVEVNGKILKRSEFDSTTLAEADSIEFLYFMGGGQWR
ncbi:MAG: sulfur carrier protein ThiS [Phycisphaerae bacterium]|jgi:sulfur carrier protein|nr:sulfur carrier protein ThiS [Phycisphaerae bacterium]|tara:strand:- start:159 stop:371 length:213 start_codon:yes stop_codon:yes gene_type:complete